MIVCLTHKHYARLERLARDKLWLIKTHSITTAVKFLYNRPEDAFACTNETLASVMAFIDSVEAQSRHVSDLSGAVLKAIELDKKVWSSGLMPDNALTTIVLITDGRSAGGNHQVAVSPIFYEQLFRTKDFLRSFYVLTIRVCNFSVKGFGHKSCS